MQDFRVSSIPPIDRDDAVRLPRPPCQDCGRNAATAYGKWVRCDSCAEMRLDLMADAMLERGG